MTNCVGSIILYTAAVKVIRKQLAIRCGNILQHYSLPASECCIQLPTLQLTAGLQAMCKFLISVNKQFDHTMNKTKKKL